MFCYFIYFAILYFGVAPYVRYEMFIMPMILRGFGMMVLFIAYARSLQNAISQGHGFEQAQQVAALVVAVVSAFIPFHKAVRVKVVKTGEDMV